MKKLLVAAAAFALSANIAIADDKQGGDDAAAFALGNVNAEYIVAGAVGIAVAAAIISNSSGSSLPDPGSGPQPVPTCNQGDQLSGNVCIATTQTITITGSGTGTTTATVPVTSTYAPTLR